MEAGRSRVPVLLHYIVCRLSCWRQLQDDDAVCVATADGDGGGLLLCPSGPPTSFRGSMDGHGDDGPFLSEHGSRRP